MKPRKAQVSGTPAAAVILVIAAFILIWIVLIPTEDRETLLENGQNETEAAERQETLGTLLEERPGTIRKQDSYGFYYSIPSFNLIVKKEDRILKEVDSVFIESGGVSSRAVPFFERDRAENGRLAFSVKDHSGVLTILFNGEQIFRGEVNDLLEPLALDKIEEENILEFSVDSPPGWQFWKKNQYDIRNLKITATVENVENQEALTTFAMNREKIDPENVENAYISYWVDCDVRTAGRLTVHLNNHLLSSRVPDCGSPEKTAIDPDDFVEGRNELRFSAEKGNYLIDRISVRAVLKDQPFPVYFFYVNETQFRKIDGGELNTTLLMKFVDDDRKKEGVINVNDRRLSLSLRSREYEYSRNIDAFLREGSNSIQIEPDDTLHVLELKVKLD